MKKTIYAYFNNNDLSELLNGLLQKNMPLFNDKREQIIDLPFAEKNITEVNKNCFFLRKITVQHNQVSQSTSKSGSRYLPLS